MIRLTREEAQRNKVYQEICDEALRLLSLHNSFSFAEVLEQTSYGPFADKIKWHYIRQFIEESTGKALQTVNDRFFRRHNPRHEREKPAIYLAGSGGTKTTAGYVWLCDETSHLFSHSIATRGNRIIGMHKSYAEAREQAKLYLVDKVQPPALDQLSLLLPIGKASGQN